MEVCICVPALIHKASSELGWSTAVKLWGGSGRRWSCEVGVGRMRCGHGLLREVSLYDENSCMLKSDSTTSQCSWASNSVSFWSQYSVSFLPKTHDSEKEVVLCAHTATYRLPIQHWLGIQTKGFQNLLSCFSFSIHGGVISIHTYASISTSPW